MAKLKYGTIDGKEDEVMRGLNGGKGGAFAASGVLSAKSGRFVVYDVSDGYFKPCADNAAIITGYVEQSLTCSATDGTTKLPIISVQNRIFELPFARAGSAATLTQAILDAIIGLKIDLLVASNIQYADDSGSGTAGSQAILKVEGGDVAENTLFVSVVDSLVTSQA